MLCNSDYKMKIPECVGSNHSFSKRDAAVSQEGLGQWGVQAQWRGVEAHTRGNGCLFDLWPLLGCVTLGILLNISGSVSHLQKMIFKFSSYLPPLIINKNLPPLKNTSTQIRCSPQHQDFLKAPHPPCTVKMMRSLCKYKILGTQVVLLSG